MLGQIAAFTLAATVITITLRADMAEPGDPVVAISIAALLAWGWLVGRASGALAGLRWRASLERVTGCVLVVLGLRLGATSR